MCRRSLPACPCGWSRSSRRDGRESLRIAESQAPGRAVVVRAGLHPAAGEPVDVGVPGPGRPRPPRGASPCRTSCRRLLARISSVRAADPSENVPVHAPLAPEATNAWTGPSADSVVTVRRTVAAARVAATALLVTSGPVESGERCCAPGSSANRRRGEAERRRGAESGCEMRAERQRTGRGSGVSGTGTGVAFPAAWPGWVRASGPTRLASHSKPGPTSTVRFLASAGASKAYFAVIFLPGRTGRRSPRRPCRRRSAWRRTRHRRRGRRR